MHHVKIIQNHWEMGEMGMEWINFPLNIFSDQEQAQSDQTITDLKSIHPLEIISKKMDKKELKKHTDK